MVRRVAKNGVFLLGLRRTMPRGVAGDIGANSWCHDCVCARASVPKAETWLEFDVTANSCQNLQRNILATMTWIPRIPDIGVGGGDAWETLHGAFGG